MSNYPNSNVFIVKVQNKTYLAFLLNQDGTRIKFFDSGEIIPKSELGSYIQRKYHKSYDWVKVMRGNNPFHQFSPISYRSQWLYNCYPTGIRDDIEKAIGSKPSTNYLDYDSDNDGYMSSWKEKRKISFKNKQTTRRKGKKSNQKPTINKHDSVTEYEICEVMTWYASKDNQPQPTQNYSSVLDF